MEGKAEPVLCKNGCGFYGRPETKGFCSRCASNPNFVPPIAEGELNKMSEMELRAIVATAGSQSDDCFTLAELRARAARSLPSVPLETTQLTMAGLTCYIKGPVGEKVDLVVLMMHGYSATAAELFPIADSMSKNPHIRGLKVLYVMPQAPGYPTAWWDIDLDMWTRAAMTGNIENLLRTVPNGLPEARLRGLQLLKEIQTLGIEEKIPMSRIIIGGFSQGAMTAVDLALQLPPEEQCGGVMALSGCPIVVHEWEDRLSLCSRPPPVLITHGSRDPVLPVLGADIMHKILQRGKCEVTLQKHPGGHELGPACIVTCIARFWAKVVQRNLLLATPGCICEWCASQAPKTAIATATTTSATALTCCVTTIGLSQNASCVVHLSSSSSSSSFAASSSTSASSASSSSASSSSSSISASPSPFSSSCSSSVSTSSCSTLSSSSPSLSSLPPHGSSTASDQKFADSMSSVIGPNGILITPLEPFDGEEEEEEEEAEIDFDDDEMLARALELSMQETASKQQ